MAAQPGSPYQEVAIDRLPRPYNDRVRNILRSVTSGRATWGRSFDPRGAAEELLQLMPSADSLVLSLDSCRLGKVPIVECNLIQYQCARSAQADSGAQCWNPLRPIRAGEIAQRMR